MFKNLCASNDYVLSSDLAEMVSAALDEQVAKKSENFSNGRLVRNIYDDLVMNHARRVASIEEPSREDLSIITSMDFSRSATEQ